MAGLKHYMSYLAGIIDAAGKIRIVKAKASVNPVWTNPTPCVWVTLPTDWRITVDLLEHYGGTLVETWRRDCVLWRLKGKPAYKLLSDMRKLLDLRLIDALVGISIWEVEQAIKQEQYSGNVENYRELVKLYVESGVAVAALIDAPHLIIAPT